MLLRIVCFQTDGSEYSGAVPLRDPYTSWTDIGRVALTVLRKNLIRSMSTSYSRDLPPKGDICGASAEEQSGLDRCAPD